MEKVGPHLVRVKTEFKLRRARRDNTVRIKKEGNRGELATNRQHHVNQQSQVRCDSSTGDRLSNCEDEI